MKTICSRLVTLFIAALGTTTGKPERKFQMRTLYTLFALISLALMALVATAAPPTQTFDVTCDPSPFTAGNCASGSTPTFHASGLNPHKDYVVFIPESNAMPPLLNIDKQGNDSEPSGDGPLSGGTFHFTLWQLDNKGNLNIQIGITQSLTFD